MQTLWPIKNTRLSTEDIAAVNSKVNAAFKDICKQQNIGDDLTPFLNTFYIPFADWLHKKQTTAKQTLIIGINGAQGSGKSTLATLLACILEKGFALNTVILSIDDIYKTRQQRQIMARQVQPLFETRGAPGTHDTELGIQLLSSFKHLKKGETMTYPVFDKAKDDRAVQKDWPCCEGAIDIVFFEGWCVGAPAQKDSTIKNPINALERDEDSSCIWRKHVNNHLKTDYKELFTLLDYLIFLKIPSFDAILKWRGLQEQKLIAKNQQEQHLMASQKSLRRFIQHFERLTRHQLDVLPDIAELTIHIGNDHQAERVLFKRS